MGARADDGEQSGCRVLTGKRQASDGEVESMLGLGGELEQDVPAAIEPEPAVRVPRVRIRRARYDAAFGGVMALLIMGLAVYAAGPGAILILGSAVAGLAIAVLYLRRNNR